MNVIRGERLNVNFGILCTLLYQVSFVNKHLKVEGGNAEIGGSCGSFVTQSGRRQIKIKSTRVQATDELPAH